MKKNMILAFNRVVLTVGFLLTGCFFAQAQTFIGTMGNQLWSDSGNWLDGLMPNSESSYVTISADVIVDQNVNIGTLYNSGNFSLTVKEGYTLTANASIIWGDENDFILEDKAQLVCPTPVKVTAKKKIFADDHLWNLIASPVEDDITPSIENGFLTEPETGYALYSFDQATAQWNDFKESPFVIEKGRGYLYANALDTTLLFEGKTIGTLAECGLSYHASNGALAGCNVIGNPLPCNAFVGRSYYFFSEVGNSMIAVPFSMGRPITPCTGIIVQSKGIEDATVRFDNGVFEQPDENRGYIEITATKSDTPTEILDQALLSFNAGDDLAKYQFFEDTPWVYFTKDDQDLAVLSIDSVDALPLKFKAEENGSYTLHFDLKELNLNYLHLIDNIAGVNHNLLNTPDYTFSAQVNDYALRFKMVFDPHYGVEEFGNKAFAYYADGMINIVEAQDVASLQMIDMTGRVVISRVGDATNRISTEGLAPGIYLLRLNNGNAVKTQRIVIE
ncbi:MAG: T9SS type A sorting domain-containing protein [Bacteroidales bacterium]|nr:T9SS type A sorting domain-containing protein [Bacteroidales bacterium]